MSPSTSSFSLFITSWAFAKRYDIPQTELTVEYMDFWREINKEDVTTWIQDGYISNLEPELKEWLDGDKEFEVVDILCYEWYYE